jgi:uncharacterized damage-inducible protein DinB
MQLLKVVNTEILEQLAAVLAQLSPADYKKELKVLNTGTIGQHVRHILEFYGCLLQGATCGCVDYDSRQRNLRLEADHAYALDYLAQIDLQISKLQAIPVKLAIGFGCEQAQQIPTSMERELTYLIEHSIHHLAIIKIALVSNFEAVQIPQNFGVAYSTIQYHKNKSA